MKVAVVGGGIAGLSAAWLLSRRHEVVLFEREMRLGGHSNTVDVGPGGRVPVDTGFIVYNTASYPNLVALFDHLGVATAPTEMSFSVSLASGGYEYNGNGFAGFFGQRTNFLSPRHWRMGADVLRFFREARALLADGGDDGVTLGDWLRGRRYSDWFVSRHIMPMGAAIWSTPAARMMDFPARAFMGFFANHGLLQINDRPQWRTVEGGSRSYVSQLSEEFRGTVNRGDAVVSVLRGPGGVAIRTADGQSMRFDRCLIACHADQALGLLKDADEEETRALGAFKYARNEAVLHTDPGLMPRRRGLWSSWNYQGCGQRTDSLTLTYWMNRLQPLRTEENYFVTLNPGAPIAEERVMDRQIYEHPMFDANALAAQKRLWNLQGRRRTWFAGSYFAFGFHECALQSGLAAAEEIGELKRPWKVAGESDRLQVPLAGRGAPRGVATQ